MRLFFKWRLRTLLGLLSKLIPSRKTKLIKNILVIIKGGIGDGIMTLPVVKTLNSNFKNASFTLVSSNLLKNIISSEVKVRRWFSIQKNIYQLVKEKFDIVFVNVVGVHHTEFLIYSLLSRAPYRLGPIYPQERFSVYTHPYVVTEDEHDVIQNLKILSPLGVKITHLHPVLSFFDNIQTTPIIGIHPGGDKRQTLRRWPSHKFAKLLDVLYNKYKASIWLFEGKDEIGLCSEIARLCTKKPTIIKNKTIKEVCALIKKCTLFITSDSGLGHIADALGVPTVTIFGPSNPKRTAPFRNQENVVYKNLSCSPCYASGGCIFSKRKCLEEIEPQDVVVKIEKIKNKN
jgi:ADP-heptose:LPS heptosyltransferase